MQVKLPQSYYGSFQYENQLKWPAKHENHCMHVSILTKTLTKLKLQQRAAFSHDVAHVRRGPISRRRHDLRGDH